MKEFVKIVFGFVMDIMPSVILLWCVVGLWACCHKIRTLEEEIDCIKTTSSRIESPENKIMLMAYRCRIIERDVDILSGRVDGIESSMCSATNVVVVENKDPVILYAVDDLIQ